MTTKADRHHPSTRPKKSETDKRKRQNLHRKRLVALGMKEEVVKKLSAQDMRTLLRNPKKIKA